MKKKLDRLTPVHILANALLKNTKERTTDCHTVEEEDEEEKVNEEDNKPMGMGVDLGYRTNRCKKSIASD